MENSDLKIMIHVGALSKPLEFSQDGYLHVYQPYERYIWGRGILNVKGALKYAELMERYRDASALHEAWQAYLHEQKKKSENSAITVQKIVRGHLTRYRHEKEIVASGEHWLAKSDILLDDMDQKIYALFQFHSSVLGKHLLTLFVTPERLPEKGHHLLLKAGLLKIALELIKEDSLEEFSIEKIRMILERDPDLIWKRFFPVDDHRTFFVQFLDEKKPQLISILDAETQARIRETITEPLSNRDLFELREKSSATKNDQTPFEALVEASNAADNFRLHEKEIAAWIALGGYPPPFEYNDWLKKLKKMTGPLAEFLNKMKTESENSAIFLSQNKRPHFLHEAINAGRAEEISHLLKFFDLNEQDDDGNTPLHLSLKQHNQPLSEKIISLGGDLYIQNLENKSPFDFMMTDNFPGTDLIIEEQKHSAKMKNFWTQKLKNMSTVRRDYDQLERFVNYGGDPNAVAGTIMKKSLLSQAVKDNRIDVIRFLIERGADPTLVIEQGSSFEEMFNSEISAEHKIEVAQMMLSSPFVSPDFCNEMLKRALSKSPLNWGIIFMLIQHGANPDIEVSRESVLLFAIKEEKKDVVEKLLELGANPNNVKLVTSAFKLKKWDMAKILINSPKMSIEHLNQLLSYLLSNVDSMNKGPGLDMVLMLIDRGANPNTKNERGKTVLHLAVKAVSMLVEDRRDLIQKLFEKGADANIENKSGLVALHLAVKEGDQEIIQKVKRNTNINSNILATGLLKELGNIFEMRSYSGGDDDLTNATLWVDWGGDVNSKQYDYTLLRLAVEKGDVVLVKKLISSPKIDLFMQFQFGRDPIDILGIAKKIKKTHSHEIVQILETAIAEKEAQRFQHEHVPK